MTCTYRRCATHGCDGQSLECENYFGGHQTEPDSGAVQRPVDHELKTWPEFFSVVESGEKTFEIRLNDRGFHAGHILRLNEWSRGIGYTGRFLDREVTYLLEGPAFGIERGYVAMALGPAPADSGCHADARSSVQHSGQEQDAKDAALTVADLNFDIDGDDPLADELSEIWLAAMGAAERCMHPGLRGFSEWCDRTRAACEVLINRLPDLAKRAAIHTQGTEG